MMGFTNGLVWCCVLLAALFNEVLTSCLCSFDHLQTTFCEKNFVASVVVKSMKPKDHIFTFTDGGGSFPPEYVKYKVHIKRQYKRSNMYNKKNVNLLSEPTFWRCGEELNINATRIVFGYENQDGVLFSGCDILSPRYTSRRIRRYLKSAYGKNCNCSVYQWPSIHNPMECYTGDALKSEWSCYYDLSYCKEQKDGTCRWKNNKSLKKCMKNIR